jgi:hypothetical protein
MKFLTGAEAAALEGVSVQRTELSFACEPRGRHDVPCVGVRRYPTTAHTSDNCATYLGRDSRFASISASGAFAAEIDNASGRSMPSVCRGRTPPKPDTSVNWRLWGWASRPDPSRYRGEDCSGGGNRSAFAARPRLSCPWRNVSLGFKPAASSFLKNPSP